MCRSFVYLFVCFLFLSLSYLRQSDVKKNMFQMKPRLRQICLDKVFQECIYWTGTLPNCRFMYNSTKPIFQPMLAYCELYPWGRISVKFKSKYNILHWIKSIWICILQNGSIFVFLSQKRANRKHSMIDRFHKSHNTPVPHPTMHHLIRSYEIALLSGYAWITCQQHGWWLMDMS